MNVIIAGFGLAGRYFHAAVIRAVPELRLSGVVTSRTDEVKSLYPGAVCYPDLTTALAKDPAELVIIATPHDSHAALATEALKAGRHVVIDKPFATALNEAEALVALAEGCGLKLGAFHNRRWDSGFLTLKALINEARLGTLRELHLGFDRLRTTQSKAWKQGGGPVMGLWYDLGPHLIDQALCLSGRPKRFRLDLTRLREGANSDEGFVADFDYGDHRITLRASTFTTAPGPVIAAHGTLGSYVKYGLDPQEDQLRAGLYPESDGFGVDPQPGVLTPVVDGKPGAAMTIPTLNGCMTEYYRTVAAAVRGQGDMPVPAQDGLETLRILEGGLAASETGGWVDIEKISI